MELSLDKILTASVRDYIESVKGYLSDYEMRGVHYRFFRDEEILSGFSSIIPKDTEAVTDFRIFLRTRAIPTADIASGDTGKGYVSGMALIPKNRSE